MVGVLFCLLVAYERGGGTAVMAVGYVEVWYFVEGGCDAVVEGFVDYPEGVAEAVGGHEIILRLAGDYTRDYLVVLRAAVHGLRIYIIVFLVVLHEPSLALECVEILDGALVHLGGVLVLAGSEVDFGLDDVVERLGVAFGLGTCFLAVEHIVGTRSHFGDKLFGRTDSLERFNFCHVS